MRHCDRVEEQKCAAERRDFDSVGPRMWEVLDAAKGCAQRLGRKLRAECRSECSWRHASSSLSLLLVVVVVVVCVYNGSPRGRIGAEAAREIPAPSLLLLVHYKKAGCRAILPFVVCIRWNTKPAIEVDGLVAVVWYVAVVGDSFLLHYDHYAGGGGGVLW